MKYIHNTNQQLHIIIGNTGRDIIVCNIITGKLFTVFINDFNSMFTLTTALPTLHPAKQPAGGLKYMCANCHKNEVGAPDYYCMDCFVQDENQ